MTEVESQLRKSPDFPHNVFKLDPIYHVLELGLANGDITPEKRRDMNDRIQERAVELSSSPNPELLIKEAWKLLME